MTAFGVTSGGKKGLSCSIEMLTFGFWFGFGFVIV
jgi:hypothetical protein